MNHAPQVFWSSFSVPLVTYFVQRAKRLQRQRARLKPENRTVEFAAPPPPVSKERMPWFTTKRKPHLPYHTKLKHTSLLTIPSYREETKTSNSIVDQTSSPDPFPRPDPDPAAGNQTIHQTLDHLWPHHCRADGKADGKHSSVEREAVGSADGGRKGAEPPHQDEQLQDQRRK